MSEEPVHTHPSHSPESEGRSEAAERILNEQVPIVVTELLSKVLAIKEGETFLYSDTEGNLDDRPGYGLGLYYQDTRFLSRFRMRISGRDPILLSSSAERSYMSYIDVTTPDLFEEDEMHVPYDTLKNVR